MNTKRLSGKATQVIRWPYELVGVFAAAAWYFCNQFHDAFLAARTKCDVDAVSFNMIF